MWRADRNCYFHGHFVTYPSSVIDSHLRLVNATFPTEGKALVGANNLCRRGIVRTTMRTAEDVCPYKL